MVTPKTKDAMNSQLANIYAIDAKVGRLNHKST